MATIMQICASPSWGGMEMHVGFLSTQLAKRGHEIIPVCHPGSPLEQNLHERGFMPLRIRLGGYFHPSGISKLAQLVDENGVDLVHSHYSRDLWTIVPALWQRGRVPLILTKHLGTQKPKRDPLHRWIYRRVDHAIAISAVIRRNLLATHPLRPEQVSVVHHGVDLSQFAPEAIDRSQVRQELGLAPEHLVLGMVGRIQVSKGYLEFLAVARQIAAEVPQARFLLIGEASRGETGEAEMILAKIKEWQLDKVVRHLGFQRDIPRLLAAMDIFVFPSHAEAFGLALIEAMAMAKPVIASNCDGVLDIVIDQQTGLMVPPRDVAAISQAVRALARDAGLRAAIGCRGREHVVQYFSLDRMLNEIDSIYHTALSKTAII